MDEVRISQSSGDELIALWRRRPIEGSSVREWVAWLEPQIVLWNEIAAQDAALAPNAQFMADYVRDTVQGLREQYTPSDRWSGVASW